VRERAASWVRSPFRRPVFLEGSAWLYAMGTLVPVLLAVLFSFNAGRSTGAWQGFSLRWWIGKPSAAESLLYAPDLRRAILQSLLLAALTTLAAVPLGSAFALGLDRWRGRGSKAADFTMMLCFVTPEIILGVAFLLLFVYVFHNLVAPGTGAEVLGLVTYQLPYPAVIVRARLLSQPPEYEKAAVDLGASRLQAVRRVVVPMLYPALLAGAILVFVNSIGDFVIVNYLSGPASSQPLSVVIYNAARAAPPPSVNAGAAFMLLATLLPVVAVGLIMRRLSRRDMRAVAVEVPAET
jgi:spermidine/putrescine transport system permease protein